MARARAAGVVAAVRRDLRRMPEDLRDCAEAATALELARAIDQGLTVAQCSKELRGLLAELRTRANPVVKPGGREAPDQPDVPDFDDDEQEPAGVGDLLARIADRRGAAQG